MSLFTTPQTARIAEHRPEKAAQVREAIGHCYGSQQVYRHWLPGVVYSEGAKALAEAADCHWLLDAIASHLPTLAKRHNVEDLRRMHLWTLTMSTAEAPLYEHDDEEGEPIMARLVARMDTHTPELIRQDIGYTDFPLPEGFKLYVGTAWGLDKEPWMIFLPSEN